MFTGLIEAVGEVLTFEQVPGGARLVLATTVGSDLRVGESVAVNGVCLTVVDHNDHAAAFDLGPETSRVTALVRWRLVRRSTSSARSAPTHDSGDTSSSATSMAWER